MVWKVKMIHLTSEYFLPGEGQVVAYLIYLILSVVVIYSYNKIYPEKSKAGDNKAGGKTLAGV